MILLAALASISFRNAQMRVFCSNNDSSEYIVKITQLRADWYRCIDPHILTDLYSQDDKLFQPKMVKSKQQLLTNK